MAKENIYNDLYWSPILHALDHNTKLGMQQQETKGLLVKNHVIKWLFVYCWLKILHKNTGEAIRFLKGGVSLSDVRLRHTAINLRKDPHRFKPMELKFKSYHKTEVN